jgi:predicted O-methyltransferase YrrM
MWPRIITNRPRLFNLAHAARLTGAFSATRQGELDCLARYAAGRQTGIEIGTFMGVSAARIAAALAPEGKLYCVDPYADCDALLTICRRHLRRAGVWSKVVMVRQTSQDAAALLPARTDFMFVDGDHSWEGIALDWAIVRRCLAPGAIACFHDTSPPPESPDESCGSVRFFEEVIRVDSEFERVETHATLNVLRRCPSA